MTEKIHSGKDILKFAKKEETHDLPEAVRSELYHMNLVVSKKIADEVGRRKTKTRLQEMKINASITRWRIMNELIGIRK